MSTITDKTQWQERASLERGKTFYFRRLDGGRMLLVFYDTRRGAWYWQRTAGPLPKGIDYCSGPDYATAEVAKGAADYHTAAPPYLAA